MAFFIASLISVGIKLIKESMEKPIPAENWANKDLYHKDIMDGVPIEKRLKYAEQGRYKLTESYPEPHRGKDGRIVIENCKLFNEDKKNYSAAELILECHLG